MSFYTSLSGLRAAQTDLAVTSNNIANVGSIGFKRSRAAFGDIMPPSSTQAGIGTRLKGIEQQFTQGNIETSSRELDLMINGSGFFVTRSGDGTSGDTFFTRDGALKIDSDRYVVGSGGAYLQFFPVDADGVATATDLASATRVQIPLTSPGGARLSDVSIDTEGLLSATFADGSIQPLGRVAVANFTNPEGLRQQGDGRWSATGESGAALTGVAGTDGLGMIQSGALERANVDLTEELVALIAAQRNFQANAKAIETANAMTQAVTNLRT